MLLVLSVLNPLLIKFSIIGIMFCKLYDINSVNLDEVLAYMGFLPICLDMLLCKFSFFSKLFYMTDNNLMNDVYDYTSVIKILLLDVRICL